MCPVWVPCVALPSDGVSSAGSSPVVFPFPVAYVPRLALTRGHALTVRLLVQELKTDREFLNQYAVHPHCLFPMTMIIKGALHA